jgi:hypothetical protein
MRSALSRRSDSGNVVGLLLLDQSAPAEQPVLASLAAKKGQAVRVHAEEGRARDRRSRWTTSPTIIPVLLLGWTERTRDHRQELEPRVREVDAIADPPIEAGHPTSLPRHVRDLATQRRRAFARLYPAWPRVNQDHGTAVRAMNAGAPRTAEEDVKEPGFAGFRRTRLRDVAVRQVCHLRRALRRVASYWSLKRVLDRLWPKLAVKRLNTSARGSSSEVTRTDHRHRLRRRASSSTRGLGLP